MRANGDSVKIDSSDNIRFWMCSIEFPEGLDMELKKSIKCDFNFFFFFFLVDGTMELLSTKMVADF